jgi:RNA polymerase sigma-70 factor (ECF subfamily)
MQGFQPKSIRGILTYSIRGVRGRPPQEAEMNFTRPRNAADSPPRPDETLCREVAKGSQEAFLTLFDRYWQQVFRIAYSIIRDEAEAEDLAQGLFLEVHRTMLRFDERKGSFRTLLLRYAYTRAIDHRRHLESRRFYSSVEYEDVNVTVLIQEPCLMSGLSLEECRHLIGQVLKHLDSKQRATVEAYFFRGLSLNEIAGELGDSFGNTRHHFYRGLERMRKALGTKDRIEEDSSGIAAKLQQRVSKGLAPEVSVVRARTI